MKLQPRQQILEIWHATARTSFPDKKWLWGGPGNSNSISDAEQLLCIMQPAADVPMFRLDSPDQTSEDVLRAVELLGDSVEIPRLLIRVLTEYMERYTAEDGRPVFSGESYFVPPPGQAALSDAKRQLDVVDSFSTSIALTLSTIGFLRVFREVVKRKDLRNEVDKLEALASRRLSAAMIGLLRSFTVSVFDAHSPEGRALCRTVNQSGLPERQVIEEMRGELREINARLRNVTIGSGAGTVEDLDNPNRLFECGWSWGVVRDAPRITTTEAVGEQPDGIAFDGPYLYFTVVALDAIAALFSERTRLLGLLNEEQTRLAQALQLRWELTQSYWSTIATFGAGPWPLEDIPWRTTDRLESDYYSLLVTSIVVQDLVRRRAPDADLSRVGQVLGELANRARVTRRPFEKEDPALALHSPGVRIDLLGGRGEEDLQLGWIVTDFSPLLLKRIMRIASLIRDTDMRSGLLDLADRVWDHLLRRRLKADAGVGAELWDQPNNVFARLPPNNEGPSWYYSRRVVECLVTASDVVTSPPLQNQRLAELATNLLGEADHRFDQELLRGSSEAGPAMRGPLQGAWATLQRARAIIEDYPGSAFVLVSEVLRELDRLDAARSDVAGGL